MTRRHEHRSWVVIGGGVAGCVVASILSDDPSNDVVLLESGPDHGGSVDAIRDRGPLLDCPARLRADAVVTRRRGQPAVAYPQGSGLGGSSLINGGVVTGVGPAGRLPLEAPTGVGGLGRAVLAAEPDARLVRLVRRGGERVSAADVYLTPVRSRPNLTVETGTNAIRLVVEQRRVVGVVIDDGSVRRADNIVVCAGAIHTPALLLRSGIDTPGVGVGVQDHPAVTIALEPDDEHVVDEHADDEHAVDTIAVAITRDQSQTMVLDRLPGARAGASPLGAVMAATLDVSSAGRVWLPDPEGPPHVDLHQFDDPRDLDRLVAAASQLLELVGRPAIRAVTGAMYVDEHGTTTDDLGTDPDDVRRWVFDGAGGHHHVAASCRIGVVTDRHGWVAGYRGLAIADASSFPTVPRIDPYVAVIGLAERLASNWRDSPPG